MTENQSTEESNFTDPTPFEPQPERPQHIFLDYFPVDVTLATGDHSETQIQKRVIITDTHIYVLTQSNTPLLPNTLLNIPHNNDFQRLPKQTYTLSSTDTEIHISRSPSCACGSTLRGFHPFLGVPYAKTN